MLENWTVEKAGTACCACEKRFRTGQAYFSALREAGPQREESFLREDYCTECWENGESQKCFSFWKTHRRKKRRTPRVNTAVVFDFFEKLADSDQSDRREMRFVLALYLARRKALEFKEVRRDGQTDVLIFRRSGADETFRVEDPDLSEEQIEAATERLKALFPQEL
jgi:hypothetical protein